jgi:ribosomal protein L44E
MTTYYCPACRFHWRHAIEQPAIRIYCDRHMEALRQRAARRVKYATKAA